MMRKEIDAWLSKINPILDNCFNVDPKLRPQTVNTLKKHINSLNINNNNYDQAENYADWIIEIYQYCRRIIAECNKLLEKRYLHFSTIDEYNVKNLNQQLLRVCSGLIELMNREMHKVITCDDIKTAASYIKSHSLPGNVFNTLPNEIVLYLLQYCDLQTLGRLGQTSQYFRTIISANIFQGHANFCTLVRCSPSSEFFAVEVFPDTGHILVASGSHINIYNPMAIMHGQILRLICQKTLDGNVKGIAILPGDRIAYAVNYLSVDAFLGLGDNYAIEIYQYNASSSQQSDFSKLEGEPVLSGGKFHSNVCFSRNGEMVFHVDNTKTNRITGGIWEEEKKHYQYMNDITCAIPNNEAIDRLYLEESDSKLIGETQSSLTVINVNSGIIIETRRRDSIPYSGLPKGSLLAPQLKREYSVLLKDGNEFIITKPNLDSNVDVKKMPLQCKVIIKSCRPYSSYSSFPWDALISKTIIQKILKEEDQNLKRLCPDGNNENIEHLKKKLKN